MTTCDYENNGKTITQPGKFEGEPVFAPHFWNLGMEGFADEDNGSVFKFKFTKEELKHHPLLQEWLGARRTLFIWGDSQGFVHCR
jgi:hypothetical protein